MLKKNKTRTKREESEDAISILKADHEKVRGLLSELEETTTRAKKRRVELLTEIALEIRIHAQVEEEIFYPAFHEAAETEEDEKKFFEAAEEHGLVHGLLPTLEDSDPSSEVFSAKAKVLKELIEHHAGEEEEEMFPRTRKLMNKSELEDLGARIAARKDELKEQGPEVESRGSRVKGIAQVATEQSMSKRTKNAGAFLDRADAAKGR